MLMDDHQKLREVAAFWAQAPLMSIAYDLEDPSQWPTPWEMIHANEWCRNSVAIGMEATLRLAGVAADRMLLRLIIDRDIQAMLLVLVVDNTWVLNYDWGTVLPYPRTNQHIMHEWRFVYRHYYAGG